MKANMIYIDETEPEGVLEPSFPYRDVKIQRGVDANDLYEVLSEVGRGKFGTVYKCKEKSSGLKLAAKFVPIPKREDRRNVEREVEIMNSLQHHLIIQLYAAYEYQKMMCVVQELVEGGELFDRVVDDEFVLNERVCVVFIRQLCEAMEFIHRHNILHLDLKPENILCLTQEGNRIKLIDFGLARKFDPDKRLQILFGTPEFVAPEVVNFDCISYGTDMWSVGVITYVLVSGLSPFMGETDIETMANVTIAKYDFEDESFSSVSSECIDFISKLLVKDLSIRMTASQCLEHKWLQRRLKSSTKVPSKGRLNAPLPNGNKVKSTTNSASVNAAAIDLIENIDDIGEKTFKELDTTKDNLKNFIERWEEHPNSPYVFDVEGNLITPLNEDPCKTGTIAGNDSITSSRVCSPSPCGSIEAMTDDEKITDAMNDSALATPINESNEKLFTRSRHSLTPTPTPTSMPTSTPMPTATASATPASFSDNNQQRSLKSYLHTFDRRNSDTSCLLGRRSSSERVTLADEIKKLSDHLLMLAEINTKLGNDVKTSGNHRALERPTNDNDRRTKSALNPTKVNFTKAQQRTECETANDMMPAASSSNFFKQMNPTKTRTSNLTLRLQKSLAENLENLENENDNTKQMTNKARNVTGNKKSTRKTDVQEAASIKRAKFRISQMSRDVPIGLPDMHQTVNLEEAANNTKDCLLHLLEKYNEVKSRNPLGRHQSISISNFTDNLEYRSMSSINAFFQRHSNTGDNIRQLQAQLKNKTDK